MELYNKPHNLVRKLRGLKNCINVLEHLYPPIFFDDPMIAGHLKRLKADYKSVKEELQQYPNHADIAMEVWKEDEL